MVFFIISGEDIKGIDAIIQQRIITNGFSGIIHKIHHVKEPVNLWKIDSDSNSD